MLYRSWQRLSSSWSEGAVNMGYDMLCSCSMCITSCRVFVRGNILLMDNAKIHHAKMHSGILSPLLDVHGVRLLFLPAYRCAHATVLLPCVLSDRPQLPGCAGSPELNPAELVFGRAKRYMRMERGSGSFVEVTRGRAPLNCLRIISRSLIQIESLIQIRTAQELLLGLTKTTVPMMRNFYCNCLVTQFS